MINRYKFLGQPVKNNLKTYYSIQKITMGQGDDYITCSLLDYLYFEENYELMTMDLSK